MNTKRHAILLRIRKEATRGLSRFSRSENGTAPLRTRGVILVRALSVAAAALAVASWSLPDRVEAQQPRSLDEQLLEDLGANPLDEFDREPSGPADQKGRVADPPGRPADDLRDRLRRELGAAAEAEDADPLLALARRMREAEALIAQNDSGAATRGLQQQIIVDLDELIRQAAKRCGQCKGGGKPGAKPGKKQQVKSDTPAGPPRPKSGSGGGKQPGPTVAGKNDTPNPAPAPVQRVDVGQMQELIKELWGQLPQRDREQMIHPPPEEFLPKYELMIEEYYRRLSEGKQP